MAKQIQKKKKKKQIVQSKGRVSPLLVGISIANKSNNPQTKRPKQENNDLQNSKRTEHHHY